LLKPDFDASFVAFIRDFVSTGGDMSAFRIRDGKRPE